MEVDWIGLTYHGPVISMYTTKSLFSRYKDPESLKRRVASLQA